MTTLQIFAAALVLFARAEPAPRAALNHATFERVWTVINDRYWDPEFGGVDGRGVHDELLPRALAAAGDAELRAVLEDMIGRLGQSHFAILPGGGPAPYQDGGGEPPVESAGAASTEDRSADLPDVAARSAAGEQSCAAADRERLSGFLQQAPPAPRASPGFEVASVGDGLLVVRLEPGGAAERAGIGLGWELVRAADARFAVLLGCLDASGPVGAALTRQLVTSVLDGHPGSRVEVVMRDATGALTEHTLVRAVPAGAEPVRFGIVPAMDFVFEARRLDVAGGPVQLVRFNYWLMPVLRRFEDTLLEGGPPAALVIDLRGNPGGVGGLSMGIAGYLVAEAKSLGTMRTRGDAIEFRINPRRVVAGGKRYETFTGKVALLVDAWSASTSEIFAAGLQDLGRARVFGGRSMGAALPSVLDPLPNGDLLYNAIADFLRPAGRRIEGEGVTPDEDGAPSREALLAGKDEPLEAALRWIRSER